MSDGFFKRGKVWWFRTDPLTGKQASSGKRDLESAKLEYTARSRLATDPSYQPAHAKADQSLNHWAVKFVTHKRATKAGPTAKFYADKLGHVVRLLGADVPISNALRPANMDSYALTRQAEGARATTIRKEIGSARTLARWTARQGAYHGRPELLMPDWLGDDYEPGERVLTPDELGALLDHLSPHRRAWVALAVATGCRYSETPRVTVEDIDLAAWQVRVRGTKTKRAFRTVPIAAPFRGLLGPVREHLPLRPWLNANMGRDLALACSKAGIEPVTANDLRRTHGSWLSAHGVDDEHVGKVLGHTDGRMARRVYAKLRPEQLGALIDAKVSATRAQQSERQAQPEKPETPADSEEWRPCGEWIENPRVGGSTPSRDTSKTAGFVGDSGDRECHGIPQTDAVGRSVRNESATGQSLWWLGRAS